MSEINEFQHPDPIWTWKSNKRGGLHEGFRVGLADLLIGLPRTAVPADRGLQLSEGRNRDAPDLERVLAAAFRELRQREDRVSDAPFAEVDGNDVVEQYVTLGFGIRPIVDNGDRRGCARPRT